MPFSFDGAGAALFSANATANFVAVSRMSIAQHPQKRVVVGASTLTSICRSG